MKVRGKVFSGAARGAPLIEKYYARLIGIVGFKPFFGTLNVKLEMNFDMAAHATKKLDHVLRGGKQNVDAYLAPAMIRKVSGVYKAMEMRDREGELLERLKKLRIDAKDADIETETEEVTGGLECWAIQFVDETHNTGVIEIIAKEELRKVLGLQDGDAVEIEIRSKSFTKEA